jgi:hypothetical protein
MEYIPEGTRLAPTSRALFNKKLQQYTALMPQAYQQTVGFIIDNPGIAYTALTTNATVTQTPTNRHLFFSAVVAYIKHTSDGQRRSDRIKNKWLDIQKSNWHEQQTLDETLSEKDTEVATHVQWQDIIKARDALPQTSLIHLLLAFYTYLPPLRADYFEVRINPPPTLIKNTKKNYIQLTMDPKTSTLVIRDFKTASKYKTITHILPPPLHATLLQSLQTQPRKYLFTMPTDNSRPYDRNGFSKWANKVLQHMFKAPLTLTSLRHLFISTLDLNKLKASELQKIAHDMGHGLSMQKEYQWIL